jgi:hypothetical protein
MNCKGVAQVMKARLEASTIGALHPGTEAQLGEDSVCGPSCNAISVTAKEEFCLRLGRMVFVALAGIGSEHVDQIWAEWHESRLVELAFPNLDEASREIYVTDRECKCFADT